ncbi:MAG: DNA repair protein RecO C-terminal domain-containing protein [Bacteroidaceae bacterium]|nr:DNA repair protein RecO C-terminal domain-containing protein [Bacteroidaceae bacterium]
MIHTSKAIVLSITRYNDDTIIAETYTEQNGLVAFAVKINRSARASIRHTLFQPLALLEICWEEKSTKRSLMRPKSVRAIQTFASLPYDPHKMAMALFMAEFLHYALRSEPDSLYIYAYIEQSLLWLDHCNKNFANFHLVFLVKLTYFLGISPNVENPERNEFFDLRASCFVNARPPHQDFIPNPEAQFIPMLLRMRYENMHVFKFNGTERSRLLHYINTYYRLHLDGFPDLKSLAVLKELFT